MELFLGELPFVSFSWILQEFGYNYQCCESRMALLLFYRLYSPDHMGHPQYHFSFSFCLWMFLVKFLCLIFRRSSHVFWCILVIFLGTWLFIGGTSSIFSTDSMTRLGEWLKIDTDHIPWVGLVPNSNEISFHEGVWSQEIHSKYSYWSLCTCPPPCRFCCR